MGARLLKMRRHTLPLPVAPIVLLLAARTTTAAADLAAGLAFDSPLFGSGMLLQRGAATKVWGTGATPHATVTVRVHGVTEAATATANADGTWLAHMPELPAMAATQLTASDGKAHAALADVAIGDLLLCGGQVRRKTPTPPAQPLLARRRMGPYTWDSTWRDGGVVQHGLRDVRRALAHRVASPGDGHAGAGPVFLQQGLRSGWWIQPSARLLFSFCPTPLLLLLPVLCCER